MKCVTACMMGLGALLVSAPPAVAETVVAGPKAVVGTTTASYALAYSNGRHLFYRDGWFVFYHDGRAIRAAFSRDGATFRDPEVVSHLPVSVCFSVYEDAGTVILLYTDPNYADVYWRRGRVQDGRVIFGEPRLVIATKRSFAGAAPAGLMDEQGIPWVVYRSNDGAAGFRVWLTRASDSEGTAWATPIVVSTPEAVMDSGAGTSGVPVNLGGRLGVLYSGGHRLYMVEFDKPAMQLAIGVDEWVHATFSNALGAMSSTVPKAVFHDSIVDPLFSGIHDFSSVVDGDVMHLASLGGNAQVVYRRYHLNGPWEAREILGQSDVHSTTLGMDQAHRVWVFYAQHGRRDIMCRVKSPGAATFGPERLAVHVPDGQSPSYLWPASSVSRTAPRVGLMWLEGAQPPHRICFQTFEISRSSRRQLAERAS